MAAYVCFYKWTCRVYSSACQAHKTPVGWMETNNQRTESSHWLIVSFVSIFITIMLCLHVAFLYRECIYLIFNNNKKIQRVKTRTVKNNRCIHLHNPHNSFYLPHCSVSFCLLLVAANYCFFIFYMYTFCFLLYYFCSWDDQAFSKQSAVLSYVKTIWCFMFDFKKKMYTVCKHYSLLVFLANTDQIYLRYIIIYPYRMDSILEYWEIYWWNFQWNCLTWFASGVLILRFWSFPLHFVNFLSEMWL